LPPSPCNLCGVEDASLHGTPCQRGMAVLTRSRRPRRAQGVHITLRMRLMCEVWRAGRDAPEQAYEVMNEVVVDRGANPYLTKIECWEHGRLITKVRCYRACTVKLAHRVKRVKVAMFGA